MADNEILQKLEKIESRIADLKNELNMNRESLQILAEQKETELEGLALGDVDEKDLKQTEDAIEEVSKLIERNNDMIQRLQANKMELAPELIPILKAEYDAEVDAHQAKADAQFEAVKKARSAYMKEIREYGEMIRTGYHIQNAFETKKESIQANYKRSNYLSNPINAELLKSGEWNTREFHQTWGISERQQELQFGRK